MQTVDIKEAQSELARFLTMALRGMDVVIAQDDVPLVRLVPINPAPKRVADLHKGAMVMRDDFNDPLPDEFWLGTE